MRIGVMNMNEQGFAEVWARVSPPEPPNPAEQDAGELSRLIAAESRACEYYERLAARGGAVGRLAQRIAAGDRAQLRRLQAEYYLLRGDSCNPAETCPLLRGGLSEIRAACLAKRRAATEYENAAGRLYSPGLAELCRRFAEQESADAETLRKLLERAI